MAAMVEHLSDSQQRKRLKSLSAVVSAAQQEAAHVREWRLQRLRENDAAAVLAEDLALERYVEDAELLAEVFSPSPGLQQHAQPAAEATIPDHQAWSNEEMVEQVAIFLYKGAAKAKRSASMRAAMDAAMRDATGGLDNEEDEEDPWNSRRWIFHPSQRRLTSEKAREANDRIQAMLRLAKLAERVHDEASLQPFCEAYETVCRTPFRSERHLQASGILRNTSTKSASLHGEPKSVRVNEIDVSNGLGVANSGGDGGKRENGKESTSVGVDGCTTNNVREELGQTSLCRRVAYDARMHEWCKRLSGDPKRCVKL